MYINQWVMGGKSVEIGRKSVKNRDVRIRPENRKRIVIRFGSVSVREGLDCVKFWSSLAVKKLKEKVLEVFPGATFKLLPRQNGIDDLAKIPGKIVLAKILLAQILAKIVLAKIVVTPVFKN